MKATHPKPKKKVDGMKKTTRCSTAQYIILAGHKAVWTMTRGLEKSEAPTVRSEIEMWKIAVAKATRRTNARAMQSGDSSFGGHCRFLLFIAAWSDNRLQHSWPRNGPYHRQLHLAHLLLLRRDPPNAQPSLRKKRAARARSRTFVRSP
jgi:hypothetical protein